MAEETEVAVEDAPKVEAKQDQDVGIEEHKLEVRVNETESSMLEDETMPTYLSLVSNVSSLKPDETQVQSDIHDAETDDEDIKSVYEVSSDDDRHEGSRARYAHRRHNNHDDDNDDDDDDDDDDEDDYEDSDDSRMNGRPRRMRYGDVTDDNDDDIVNDEEDCVEDEEDEDSDGDIEAEQFERSSDDFVLRNSNSSLEKLCKERSRSLQDLSPKKSSRSNNKRQVLTHPEHYGVNPYPYNYNDPKQSSISQSKYRHVPSKVKLYIEGIKEQSRRSEQRRLSAKVNSNPYTVDIDQRNVNQENDNMRLNPQCRRLKNYSEYPMELMIGEEVPHDRLTESIDINNQITSVVNGGEIISTDAMKHYEQARDVHETMDIDDGNSQDRDYSPKQINKPNGTINYSTKATEMENNNGMRMKSLIQKEPPINGQETVSPIVEVETLTYEDYMKGNIDSSHKPDEKSKVKSKNAAEMTENPANLPTVPSSIQTENVVTAELPLPNESNNKMESDDIPQFGLVKSHMNPNSTEYVVKTDDYEKVLHENLKLKREIEELKKVLAIHKDDMKRKEVKIVAVQTEETPRIMKHTSTSTRLQLPNKLSASTMPEIGSTISSIEQWTDSECSPAISLKPPNVERLLISDDGASQASPRDSSPTPSRALWTTNRILQTLANMTPGRPIPSMVEKKFDAQGQSKDPISPLITGGKFSRKRKASDNVGSSALGPLPSKIPSINTTDARRKFNSASDTDGAIKSAGLPHDVAAAGASVSQRDDARSDQEDHAYEETDDDGVKCFVWHEDEEAQERSCLIQAPIGLEGTSKTGETKKPVRECGPYLLGNLEVRISEANGTLNIWGKEVSQKSNTKESDDIAEEEDETINDPDNFWPKTPQTMVDNRFKCSTTKKIKTPSSVRANISRHLRGMLNRTPSPVNAQVEDHLNDMPNLCQRCATNCNQCHSHKRVFSPMCHNHRNAHMKQSCCGYKPEPEIHDCNCRREHEPIIENAHCHCGIAHHRPFPSSNYNYHGDNLRQNNVCINHLSAEAVCKHAAACHRLSDSEPEDNCRHIPKRQCHSVEMNSCDHPVGNVCCQETNPQRVDVNACNNHYSSEQIDRTMNFEKSHEVPEKRSRLRGKRVRNIMEFLKGCSDCRNPETSSVDSCQIPETETTNTRSIPSIRVISDTPSTTSYHKYSNNSKNQKECDSCVKHAGRAAELEAELEIIRVEISKLHSRSNVMRDMLHRVLQTDLNSAT